MINNEVSLNKLYKQIINLLNQILIETDVVKREELVLRIKDLIKNLITNSTTNVNSRLFNHSCIK